MGTAVLERGARERSADAAPERTPVQMVEAFLEQRGVFGGRGGTRATKATLTTYRHLLLDGGYSWAKDCGSFDKGKLDDYLTRTMNRPCLTRPRPPGMGYHIPRPELPR